MRKHPELSGLTKTVGLSPKEIAENKRKYQRLYARKQRKDKGHRKRKSELSRSYYRGLSQEKKDAYCRRVNLWKYGMTVEQYDKLLEKQNGVCAICKRSPEQMLAVDHCHETGRVRGLLCRSCNLGIGHLDDDVSKVWAAMEYLVNT